MSRGYKTRQKAIRDEKRRLGHDGLHHGRIRRSQFHLLQAEWDRQMTGPPIGTLADMHPMERG